jgi:polyisoprenoid-binding protein YceI
MVSRPGPVKAQHKENAMTDLVPAGRYYAETNHSSVTWRIKHYGLAWYTGRFAKFGAVLDFDPANVTGMRLDAHVELTSVRTDFDGPTDWDSDLANREDLLDAARNPVARFVSTAIKSTGEASADVVGDLTLRGVTCPITLQTTYNGGLLKDQFDRTLVGFSSNGLLRRSEFGLTYFLGALLPDEIQLIIEAELVRES